MSGLGPGSPAIAAGLRAGDVIVAINGQRMETAGDVVDYVSGQAIGGRVELQYVRNGKKGTAVAVLGELPGGELAAASAEEGGAGLALQTLTPALAESLGLKREVRGAAITEVDAGGPRREGGAGRRRGHRRDRSQGDPHGRRCSGRSCGHRASADTCSGCAGRLARGS